MTTATAPVRKNLKMHNKLLLDVIKRQAGTLEKAILEGVMNGIEAGASEININFDVDDNDNAKLSITDDGKGISSIKEIEEFFETFGTPHDESENKIWAQFRMGRGQLFSFGKNVWRTSQFQMVVDIDRLGLEYDLHGDMPEFNGCQIKVELYKNPIGTYQYHSIEMLKASILKQVEFMNVPIFFNGEQINTPAKDCKWTDETEDAYYLFNVGTNVTIYNLGAYVMEIPASKAGTVGTIVSKKQLKVNFARNDVQSDCEVFANIQAVIKDNRIKKTRAARRDLTNDERIATLTDIRDGMQEIKDVNTLGLIRTANGRYVSFDFVRKNRLPWSFAPLGDRKADKLMQREVAVCFDEDVLGELGYKKSKARFFTWLIEQNNENGGYWLTNSTERQWNALERMYSDFDDLADGMSDDHGLIPESKWTKGERRIVKVLQSYDYYWDHRTILVGTSDTNEAWTNGDSYIVLNRDFLKRMNAAYLIAVMMHETAHDEDTSGTHIHGTEFYRRYHELTCCSDTPLWMIGKFDDMITKARTREIVDAEKAKKSKAKQKRDNALGLAASAK